MRRPGWGGEEGGEEGEEGEEEGGGGGGGVRGGGQRTKMTQRTYIYTASSELTTAVGYTVSINSYILCLLIAICRVY
jgi:hypothetical protein